MSDREEATVRDGIGGSDVSVCAGINPFKDAYDLWLEKTGKTKGETFILIYYITTKINYCKRRLYINEI